MSDEESEEQHWIKDRNDAAYSVKLTRREIGTYYKVFSGDYRIAYANCWGEPPVLHLHDLHVEKSVPAPESRFARFLRKLTGTARPTVECRKLGIGTALLRLIVRNARSSGFSEIRGKIARHDLEAFPGLIDWYVRQGFLAGPPEGAWVASIAHAIGPR